MDTRRPGDREITLDSISEQARLEQELVRAEEELALIKQKLEEKGDFGLGQGASTVYEWEMNLALRESAEAKIKSIKIALDRVNQGDYGLCEVCGQEIDPDRLEILPHTTLCVRCAQASR
ncbi:MAG: TraR/DksA C4-type zinc finger protein [Anaerolineales bacterium]|nr:MAG: TraR/DksA C4-type zinc finger protein [Anaerolineales bacterium]